MTRLITDMPFFNYLDDPCVSRSMICDFRISPQLYHGRYIDKTIPPKSATPAMKFGTMIDDLVTMGIWPSEQVPEGTVVAPDVVLDRTGARRGAGWKAYQADHLDEQIWTPREYERYREEQHDNIAICERIRDEIHAHKAADYCVNAPKLIRQPSFVNIHLGTYLISGKARPDLWLPGEMLIDVKTSSSPAPDFFCRQVEAFGYDLQAAMCRLAVYEETGDRLPFVFVVIRNSEPYDVECYELSDAFLDRGVRILENAVLDIEQCMETGVWRSKTHGQVVTVEPPRYLQYREEYEYD